MIPNVVGTLQTVAKETRGIEDQKKDRDYTDHSTVKISLNT